MTTATLSREIHRGETTHGSNGFEVVYMRKVRRVEPGVTYLITKKCADDGYIITPDPKLNVGLLYPLVFYSVRYGVWLHSFCFMSNHFHLLVTDVRGRLPDYMRDYLTKTSRVVKEYRRTTRAVWSRERYSSVTILDLDAAEREDAYCALNPVRAELVPSADLWPGLTSWHWRPGEEIRVPRPSLYFSSCFPQQVSLTLESPARAFGVPPGESDARIAQLVQEGERDTVAEVLSRGDRFPDPASLLEVPWTRRGTRPMGDLNPRFASMDPERMRRAILEDRAFHEAHTDASRRLRFGEGRAVPFPYGTWGYRTLLGVPVEEPSEPGEPGPKVD